MFGFKPIISKLTPRGNDVAAKVYNTNFVTSSFVIVFYRDEPRCSTNVPKNIVYIGHLIP